jgi:hypothetical protein
MTVWWQDGVDKVEKGERTIIMYLTTNPTNNKKEAAGLVML